VKNAAAGKYKLSEAQWQKTVIAAAQALGYLVAHFRPGMNSKGRWMTAVAGDGAGFPDLVLLHEKTGDLLFVELKRDGVSVKDASQKRWGAALALQNEYAVWQPKDWEAVRLRLSRPAGPPSSLKHS
jgi:hypothetical protein